MDEEEKTTDQTSPMEEDVQTPENVVSSNTESGTSSKRKLTVESEEIAKRFKISEDYLQNNSNNHKPRLDSEFIMLQIKKCLIRPVNIQAAIFLAGVIEYLAAECAEVAGKYARRVNGITDDDEPFRITLEDLQNAINEDQEMRTVFRLITETKETKE